MLFQFGKQGRPSRPRPQLPSVGHFVRSPIVRHFDSVAFPANMGKDHISTAAPPACLWPWHAFPFFKFHHPPQDTPRAFFALGHTVSVPHSQERPQKRRRRRMPPNYLCKPGVNSTPEYEPGLSVTPPPRRPTAKNPLAGEFLL